LAALSLAKGLKGKEEEREIAFLFLPHFHFLWPFLFVWPNKEEVGGIILFSGTNKRIPIFPPFISAHISIHIASKQRERGEMEIKGLKRGKDKRLLSFKGPYYSPINKIKRATE